MLCRGLRRLVQLALVAWFLAQCAVSVNKLRRKNVGTTEWTENEESVQYPSATMCSLPAGFDQNLTNGPFDFPPMEHALVGLAQLGFTEG